MGFRKKDSTPQQAPPEPPQEKPDRSKNKGCTGCLWLLLAVIFWPFALSWWLWSTDKLKAGKKVRIGLIAAFWVVLALFGSLGGNNTAQPTADPVPTAAVATEAPTPAPTAAPTAAPAPAAADTGGSAVTGGSAQAGDSSTAYQSGTVYIASSGNGKRYHRSPNCSNMKGATAVTLEQAEAWGYTPCKRCY